MGLYSDTFMDHFLSPHNSGAINDPDRTGHAGVPGQGPFMILYLRIAEGRVAEAKFQTYGCGTAIASGSVLTDLITSRSLEDCAHLTDQHVIQALDGVPPDKLHGPALAIAALRDALKESSSKT
jgi:NifU-like protein involved in Fe-S cluster formation